MGCGVGLREIPAIVDRRLLELLGVGRVVGMSDEKKSHDVGRGFGSFEYEVLGFMSN
ncbi:hypothetical protein JD969_10485 [Planctomycetota bacterium]|nr:hypothetical protein JD969_10485 [Planctomycetota bacterium]